MEDLIQEYQQSKRSLREMIKSVERKIQQISDPDLLNKLQEDRSLLNGMARDMNDTIKLMKDSRHELRGGSTKRDGYKEILMDPESMKQIPININETHEQEIRSSVNRKYGRMIQERMDLLTNKQKDTLIRWVADGESLAEIAESDGVTRQAVHVRIFGDRTNKGAIKKLQDG